MKTGWLSAMMDRLLNWISPRRKRVREIIQGIRDRGPSRVLYIAVDGVTVRQQGVDMSHRKPLVLEAVQDDSLEELNGWFLVRGPGTYWGWQTVTGHQVMTATKHARFPYEEVYRLPPPPQSGDTDEKIEQNTEE